MALHPRRPVSVGWGFVGAGAIATHALAPAVHAAHGATLASAGARDQARAAALSPTRAYAGYQQVLDDDSVDAVYIALGNDAHLPWILRALAAGKHVLCEKPMCLDVAETDRAIAAAADAGRLLVEASWYQWHPRTTLVRRLLADGAIGAVVHIESGFTFTGVASDNYRWDPGAGGGAGYDVGYYPVSALIWATSAPISAVAAQSRFTDRGVDLATSYVIDLADGASAALRCAFDEPAAQWLRITGDSGEINVPDQPFTTQGAPTMVELSTGTATRRLGVEPAMPYQLMIEAVSAAVAGHTPPPFLIGSHQSRACAAVLAAARTSAGSGGQPVDLS